MAGPLRTTVWLALALLPLVAGQANWGWSDKSPLDDYIAVPDSVYEWTQIDYYNMTDLGCNTYVINFTSQTWQTSAFSSNPIWFHYLLVHIPVDFVYKDAGMMYIEGGSQTSSPPDADNEFVMMTCRMAYKTKSVGALLRMIPNQPIQYPSDPSARNRTEDANIAWTWYQFSLDTSDPTIILQFPMTKAAVRALDTINAVVKEKEPTSDVKRFLVSGGSKRGWITWLLACTDPRVHIAAPIVIGVLNMQTNFHHHFESLGGWTWVFNDYYEVNLTQRLDDPSTRLLADYIDPYCYRDRLTIPKVVIAATGDEFFMPDSSWDFFDGLPEPKYMLLMENTHHGVTFSYMRVYRALQGMWTAYLLEASMPSLSWERTEDASGGEIVMTTNTVPLEVNGFWADTLNTTVRRDFRWVALNGSQPILWRNATDIVKINDFQYSLRMPLSPTSDYRGFLLNAIFAAPGGETVDFTTEINTIPWAKPFPPCEGIECYGTLV